MGLKLVDLLRWSKEITLKGVDGNPLLENDKPVKVFLRIIGDQDLDDAYKAARAASARRRASLRDKTSEDYLSSVSAFEDATTDDCVKLIVATRRRDFNNEAYANVVRPELPKIEEIAIDADAPTLEEQEKFDQMVIDINLEYAKALDSYVDEKTLELTSTLGAMPRVELMKETTEAAIDLQALQVFAQEIEIQKVWRAVYTDRTFRERAFENAEEYRQTAAIIKNELQAEYGLLELNPDDVKN